MSNCWYGSQFFPRCSPVCSPQCSSQCSPHHPSPCSCCPPVSPCNVDFISGIPTVQTIATSTTPFNGTFNGTAVTNWGTSPLVNTGGVTFDPTTGRFTIPSNGRYAISAYVTFAATAGAIVPFTVNVYIYRIPANSSSFSLLAAQTAVAQSTTLDTEVTVSTNYTLGLGDRIFVSVFQNSGTNVNILSQTANHVAIIKF